MNKENQIRVLFLLYAPVNIRQKRMVNEYAARPAKNWWAVI